MMRGVAHGFAATKQLNKKGRSFTCAIGYILVVSIYQSPEFGYSPDLLLWLSQFPVQ